MMMDPQVENEVMVRPTLDTKWWWEALRRGELLVPMCRTCGHRFFPPQAFCPNCGSQDFHGAPTSGLGAVYSWVVTHHPFSPEFRTVVPYAIVAVNLEEGARMIGRYVGDLDALRASLPVRATLLHVGGETILGFETIA